MDPGFIIRDKKVLNYRQAYELYAYGDQPTPNESEVNKAYFLWHEIDCEYWAYKPRTQKQPFKRVSL